MKLGEVKSIAEERAKEIDKEYGKGAYGGTDYLKGNYVPNQNTSNKSKDTKNTSNKSNETKNTTSNTGTTTTVSNTSGNWKEYELKTDDGTSLGFVSAAGLKAIEENNTDYVPVNGLEKKTIRSYTEYATEQRKKRIENYKSTAQTKLDDLEEEKSKVATESSKLRREKAAAQRGLTRGGNTWTTKDTRTGKEKREGKHIPKSSGQKKLDAAVTKYHNLDEEADALVETINDIDKYVNVVHNETGFWGQAKANYDQTRLNQDTAQAYNDYIESPTEGNRMRAEALSALTEQFVINNEKALTSDDESMGKFETIVRDWGAVSFAGYLPQLIDQTKASVKGAVTMGLAGATVGSVVPGIGTATGLSYGAKAGWVSGASQQMFETTRGMVFKTLIDAGYDEATALEAANDEAFVSAIIEGSGEILSMATLGTGKLFGKIAPQAAKKVSTNVIAQGVKGFVQKTGKKISENAFLKTTVAVAGVVANAAGEYVEEYSQEAVSIANERRLKNGNSLIGETFAVLRDDDEETKSRLHTAGTEGFKIGLMSGGATKVGMSAGESTSNHISNAISGMKIKNADIAQDVIDVGLNQPTDTQAYKLATKLDSKDAVSAPQIGKLAMANKGETVNVGETYYDTKSGATYNIVSRDANTTTIEMISSDGRSVTKTFPNSSADNITSSNRYVMVASEVETTADQTTEENSAVETTVDAENTSAETPTLSVGETFINSNSNNIIKVVERNDNDTTVEVTSPDGKKEIQQVPNKTADRLAIEDTYKKVEPTNNTTEVSADETVATEETSKKTINLKRSGDYYIAFGDEAIALANELKKSTKKAVVNGVETDVLRLPANLMLEAAPTMSDDFNFVFSDKPSVKVSENSPVVNETVATDETTSSAAENEAEVKITAVANAINETFLPGAKEALEKTDVKGDVSKLAELIIKYYEQSGNIDAFSGYFTDKGAKVLSVIEGKTVEQTQETNSNDVLKNQRESDTIEEKVEDETSARVESPSVKVGDVYTNNKTGDVYTVANRDSENTTVYIKNKKGVTTNVIANVLADDSFSDNDTFTKAEKDTKSTTEPKAVESEENGNERKDLLYDYAKGNDESSREQVGRIQSSHEEVGERITTAERLRNEGRTERINIDENNYCDIIHEDDYTESMNELSAFLKRYGLAAKFFVGSGINSAENIEFCGCIANHNDIYIQYDHEVYTPEMIAKHELIHYLYGSGIIKKIRNILQNSYSKAELNHILNDGRYAGYMEFYKDTGKVFEEFVCDTLSGMNGHSFVFENLVDAFWDNNYDVIDNYKVNEYAEETDAGGEVKYSLFPGGVFPPYNKSHSDTNERATRWAHNDDVETGDQRVFFYKGSPYLVKKFDSMDLGYLVVKKLSKREAQALDRYDKFEDGEIENGENQGEQRRGNGTLSNDKKHQNGIENTQRSGIHNHSSDKYNGETSGVQRVDREQNGKRRAQDHGSGNNKHGFENSKGEVNHSPKDANGKELSEGQIEYFKDSKVRDENGNLLGVYHGTRKADFTVFKRNVNFFTDSKEMADSYSPNGEIFEGYLNITKPYVIDAAGEKWSKIPVDEATKEFLSKYGASVFKEDGKWRTTPADIATAIEEAVDNGEMDYDGIIIKNIDDTGSYYKGNEKHIATDYITFDSNQFKNTDNLNPTKDKDIRYSLSKEEPYAPTFYSHMGKVIDEIKQDKIGANSVISYLKGKGVKNEEIKWTGIEEFLEGKKSVTKAELQEFVAGNQLQIEEVTLDNRKLPYSQEQADKIGEYESERNEIFEELKREWKKAIGTEFPMQTFGFGLESSVTNLLLETNRQIKESKAGNEYENAREELWDRIFSENDFGYDFSSEAFHDATRNPREFMEDFELTDDEKAIFERYISAKDDFNKIEGIPVETQRHIKDIASKADDIGRKIRRIENERNEKSSKYETKWDDYKIKGGKNYREVIFKMPDSTYSNGAMYAHWNDSIADGGGVLAHARIQDLEVDGKKMLFIEEIQSDWHNEGHKHGYRQKGQKTESDIIHADNDAYEDFWNSHVIQVLTNKLREAGYENAPTIVSNLWNGDTTSTYAFLERIGISLTNDEKGYIEEQAYQSKERNQELKNAAKDNSAPDAPFKDNYHEYVLKRLIRMAAEQGYDSIGWTPADVQSGRWSEEYAEGYRIEYDQDIPKFLNKYGKKWGARVGRTPMEIDGVSEIEYFVDDNGNKSWGWSKLFDDILTRNGISEESSKDYIAFWPNDETIRLKNDKDGSFLDEEIHYVSESASVWSMPITDSMKDSVLYEGQPRYSFSKERNLDTQKKIESIAEDIGSHEELIEYAKQNTKEFVAKIKQNESLQKRLNNAKRQMLVSPKPAVNVTQVGKITKEILAEMDSTLKATDLKDEIMSIYNEYFAEIKNAKGVESKVQAANDNMMDRFAQLAVDIVDSSEALAESESYEALKSYVRNTRIKVPDSAKADVHYAEFRKSHMGTFNLTNDGLDIDIAYMELCSMFPGMFDTDITHPADQLNEIANVLDNLKPYAYNPHSDDMVAAIDHVVFRFASEVDGLAVMPKTKAQKRAEKSKLDKDEAIKKEREKFQEKLDKRKAENEDTIRKLQGKIEDAKLALREQKQLSKEEKARAVKEVRDKRDIAILKSKIRNIVSGMKNNLDKTEKTGGYPKELVQAAADVCSVIDFHTDRTKKDGTPTKASLKLDALKMQYDALKNNPNFDFASEYSEELSDKIAKLHNDVSGKRIVDLTKAELENLKDILSEISHKLSTARKQIGQAEARENFEIATEIINSFKSAKKAISDIRNQLLKEMRLAKESGKAFVINPHRIFEMIANYDRDSAWWKLYDQILRGSRASAKFTMDATMPFDELTNGGSNEIAFYDFRTKTHKTGIKYQDGTDVQLPKSIICELVMLWDRKQGREHLEFGGVKIPDLKLFNKGRTADSLSAGKMTNPITQTDITRLKGMLDSYDKAWIERSRHLYDKVAKDAINETSMQLVGRELAKADNYIRIYVDSDFVNKDIGKNESDITIEGHGSLKETTPNAKNPVVLRGLHENVYEHIDFASKYYGLAIPIRNFNKIYKISVNEDGKQNSVKNMLGSVYGPKIRDGVVVQAIKDLQSPRHRELSFFNKVKGGWLNATFWANIRSTLKQTTSYWTASSILGEDSLVKGLATYNVHRKRTKAEIAKYSGTLYKRAQGLSTTELGDRANRKRLAGASSKVDKLINKYAPILRKVPEWIRPGNWLQSMDCAVSSTLWEACKFEVSKTMNSSDEGYMQAVTDLYERVIEETQSNYDVLHRPEILKSTNMAYQTIGMFQNDNLQQSGIMYTAFGDLQAKHKAYKADKSSVNEQKLKDAKTRMSKAIRSRIYSSMWLAAVSILGDVLLRKFKSYIDDEEKEITSSSVLEQMMMKMSEDMLSIFAPIVGELATKAMDTFGEGYDFLNDPAFDVLEDFIKATSKIYKAYNEDGDVLDAWVDAIPSISNMTGIPVKNIMDLYNAIKGYIGDIQMGEFAHDLTDYTSGNKSFYNYGDLASYIVSGDTEKETKWLDYYSENGKEFSKASLTKEIKSAYVQMYIDSPLEAQNLKRKLMADYGYSEDAIDKWAIAEYFKHVVPGKKFDDGTVSDPEYAAEIASAVQNEKDWKDNLYSTIRNGYKSAYTDDEMEEDDLETLKSSVMSDFGIGIDDMRDWETKADEETKEKEFNQSGEYDYEDLVSYIVSGNTEKESKWLDYYSENGKEFAKASLTKEIKPSYVKMYIDSPSEAYNIKRKLILDYDYSEETIDDWMVAEYFKHAIPNQKYYDGTSSNPEYASKIASAVREEGGWRDNLYSTIRTEYKAAYKDEDLDKTDFEALKSSVMNDFGITGYDIQEWEAKADKELKKKADKRQAEKSKYE